MVLSKEYEMNIMKVRGLYHTALFLICLLNLDYTEQYSPPDPTCILPDTWTGIWRNQQQRAQNSFSSKFSNVPSFGSFYRTNNYGSDGKKHDISTQSVDSTRFLNKGICMSFKDERFFFFDKAEKCFRCLFIIQRHYNVIQFRETDCYENMNNFDELCNLLAPDLPLYTMIREDAVAEKCPLTDTYQVLHSNSNSGSHITSNAFKKSLRILPETNNRCLTHTESNILTECSDNTMLRLDFQKCVKNFHSDSRLHHKRHNHKKHRQIFQSHKSNNDHAKKGVVAKCLAHWSEGNWNYLLIQQNEHQLHSHKTSQGFKCMVYKDLDRPFQNTQSNNIINPTNNLIQLSLSDDELCRDFYANSNNFILRKTALSTDSHSIEFVNFPRVFNKKWTNLYQTKYVFNSHQNILHIMHMNNHSSHIHYHRNRFNHDDSTFLKLKCLRSLNTVQRPYLKEPHDHTFLVSNLLECSTMPKCLKISQKSEFIIHLKYGHYDGKNCLFNADNLFYEDYLFIETEVGINCPFSDRIYQLSEDLKPHQVSHSNDYTKRSTKSQFSLIYGGDTDPTSKTTLASSTCEHYLKIGCNNNAKLSNDYSINKKCDYSFNENVLKRKKRFEQYSYESLPQYQAIRTSLVLPVIESESNRICLAYWSVESYKTPEYGFYYNINRDGEQSAYIVLSKARNSEKFTVACSLWESFEKSKKLKITDDYLEEFCMNQAGNTKKLTSHKQLYQKQRNLNEFVIKSDRLYGTNSRLVEENSATFDYKGTCSLSKSNRDFNLFAFIKLNALIFLIIQQLT